MKSQSRPANFNKSKALDYVFGNFAPAVGLAQSKEFNYVFICVLYSYIIN